MPAQRRSRRRSSNEPDKGQRKLHLERRAEAPIRTRRRIIERWIRRGSRRLQRYQPGYGRSDRPGGSTRPIRSKTGENVPRRRTRRRRVRVVLANFWMHFLIVRLG